MKRFHTRRRPGRSPGERAFDLCLLPFAVNLGIVLVVEVVEARRRYVPGGSKPAPSVEMFDWPGWLPGVFTVLLVAWYAWALVAVLRAWRDPNARVLRFSALGLISLAGLGFAGVLMALFGSSSVDPD